MNSTWIALAQGAAGVIGFSLFFLAPGYLVGRFTNWNSFQKHAAAEKLLWSVCLSVPIAIQICAGLGRLLPYWATMSLLLLLSASAVGSMVFDKSWRTEARAKRASSRSTVVAITLIGLLGFYFVAAATDIQLGQHLYVSTVLYDWSVRVSMVEAAMRSGVPPVNGLCALNGEAAPLRYFYFWYVVCSDLARLLHLPARVSLVASCGWAAWTLLAAFFLSLKYLLGIRRNLRVQCVLMFPILSVIGLDLIPTLRLFVVKKLHPLPEIEWWHQDRTPSFLSSGLYAPHHVAAFACLLTGLLIVASTLDREGETKRRLGLSSLIAGICFASASGTSILPTLTVAIVCVVWIIDLLRQRQIRTVAVLCGSAIIALLLAHPFLHELQTTQAAVSGNFVTLRWRNYETLQHFIGKNGYRLSGLRRQIAVQIGIMTVHLIDLGFYLFVIAHRVRRDLTRKLLPPERAIWAFLIGAAIPYFFLSSASIASPNDLGVDAGFLLRLLLQLWAVPWVYWLWQDIRKTRSFPQGHWLRQAGLIAAGACLILGLAGGMFQIVWERIYFPLVGSQRLRKPMEVLTSDHLSRRLYDIRQAYRELDRLPGAFPASAALQYNPISPLQPALTFYSTHQIAAFDYGCGTGYGGDYALCKAVMPSLLALYGNTQAGFERGTTANDRQDGSEASVATAADALSVCRSLHLYALIAESTDSIWSRPNSWVWTMRPSVVNETVRIFRCPA